jgi:DNA modification methylase
MKRTRNNLARREMRAREHIGSAARGTAAPPIHIDYRRVDSLTPNPGNPRQHTEKQIRQIAKSIETFGFLVPVLVDASGAVIAGHGRLRAARRLGLDAVPTISVSHLTEDQKRAYLIADNQLALNASWDEQLLAEQFAILASVDLDFSLDVTGFEIEAIDLLVHGDQQSDGPDPDDVPVELGPPVSRLGDVWMLGEHRLLCGDALDPVSYEVLMQGRRAALVVSDVPFNLPVDGFVSGGGKVRHREFAQASGEMSPAEFTDFLTRAFHLFVEHSVDGSLHYLFIDWRHQRELMDAGDAAYTELKNLCVWAKTNGGQGSLYRSAHELVYVYKSGTAPHQNHINLGANGRYRTNVWTYAGANTFPKKGDEERDLLKLHPTVKPVRLIADILLDASSPRDVVLDAFAGSGTIFLAAERTGRIGYGIEIDPRYVDIAVRRWERKTGRSARHATLPLTFSEIQEMREVEHD